MTASYSFDVFSTLDGFGSPTPGSWGGYWGKQGPQLLYHRAALYGEAQHLVLGANTSRLVGHFLASGAGASEVNDERVTRVLGLPATVVSSTLEGPLDWPDAA